MTNSPLDVTSSKRWDKRKHRRTRIRLVASITIDDNSPPIACGVWDMSDGGAKLAAVYSGILPERFTLRLSPTVHRRCQVRWRSEKFIGVKFIGA